MMRIDRERVKRNFAAYTDCYNARDAKIKLKIDHTYRVAAISEDIAVSLGLPASDVDLAWLAGMLHDIGRFEQLRRFGTFVDADSIDHAQFAVELLFQEGLLKEYCDVDDIFSNKSADSNDCSALPGLRKEADILCVAIGSHSAYRIEDGLDERTVMFCNILRDADKVDIFRVICDSDLEDVYGFTAQQLLQSGITPEVEQAFMEHHAVLRSLKKQPADYVVAMGALAFELVYPRSRQIAREQGYLEGLMDIASENPETEGALARMRQSMLEYMGLEK